MYNKRYTKKPMLKLPKNHFIKTNKDSVITVADAG